MSAAQVPLAQLPFPIAILPLKFLTGKSETLAHLCMDKKIFLNYFIVVLEGESV